MPAAHWSRASGRCFAWSTPDRTTSKSNTCSQSSSHPFVRGASLQLLSEPDAEPDERGNEDDEEVGRDHETSVRGWVAQGMSQERQSWAPASAGETALFFRGKQPI